MKTLIVILIFLTTNTSFAQGKGGAGNQGPRHVLAFTGIVLASSTTQGGQGPSGSSLLTNSEYVFGWKFLGLGLFTQFDMQGTAQKDSAYGPKIEIRAGNKLFFEFGYAASAKRAFTDRNISEQTGDGTIAGLGLRFGIGKAAGKGWLFQATYKYRMLTIKKQDGIDLEQPIKQSDGYPAVGFGYSF